MSETNQEIAPVQKAVLAVTGKKPMAIVPQDYDGCYRMAKVIEASGMGPKGMNANALCVTIMMGMEVGLTPMNACQNIAVINGRPSIWGDAALALVEASGLCEFVQETQVKDGNQLVAKCIVKRVGKPNAHTSIFTQQQAQNAGLWGGNVWKKYPERMLQMRARAYALRDVFPDILKGIGITEEVRDYDIGDTPKSTPITKMETAPPSTQSLNFDKSTKPEKQQDETPEPETKTIEGESSPVPDEEMPSVEQIITQLTQDLESATTADQLDEAWQMNLSMVELLPKLDQKGAAEIFQKHQDKLEAA